MPRLRTHSFGDGVVAYDPETKTTRYLPDPAGKLITLLTTIPEATMTTEDITTEDILQALARDADPLARHPEQLDALLRELEELHLVVASE